MNAQPIFVWVLLLAAVGLLVPLTARADDEPADAPAGEKPAPADEQAQVQALVEELRPVVAKLRQLEWKRGVEARVLSRAELRTFLEKQLKEDVTPEEALRRHQEGSQ